jgi:FAD/FMN-containing dehydrogenase
MTILTRPSDFRGIFRADDDARAVYSEAAGIARIRPEAVAVPEDADDLIRLVRWATAAGVPLIPRGSGSSMASGSIGPGVIVDLSRWRDIDEVNVSTRTIRVGPGALRADVDRAARRHGLRFPVDPSSGAFCTVGGMASTNAAGSHSMRFGSMRTWVRALDCIFADGAREEIRRGVQPPEGAAAIARFLSIAEGMITSGASTTWEHSRVVKDSSGYGVWAYAHSRDLVDLLVGSEGTLALFAGLELDLAPIAAATSSVLGAFTSIDAAIVAAGRVRATGAAACELLDRTFLDVAASGGAARQVPADTESALLAEVEGNDQDGAAAAASVVEQIFRDAGATTVRTALDHATETELWELRHAASPILARLDPNLKSMQFIEDCAIPPANAAAYVRGVREILAANDVRGVIFGHAGDAHVHVNPLVDVGRAGWRDRVDRILESVVSLAASLGGTLTGEHGDGRLRTPLLPRVWSQDAIDVFREVKTAFDPLGILNPGVKVALPDERPIGDVKYDPMLPALPPRAKRALDHVERERAYAEFRLDLIADPS